MPKKRTRIRTYNRRAPRQVRNTVTVRGHYRCLPKPEKKRRRRG